MLSLFLSRPVWFFVFCCAFVLLVLFFFPFIPLVVFSCLVLSFVSFCARFCWLLSPGLSVCKSDWPLYLVWFLGFLYPPSSLSFLSFLFLSGTSSSRSLVLGRRPCWRFATSCFCFSFLCLLCRVLMSWGGVLAGWSCCVCVVYVFSLCFLLRRRKVLPHM